MKVNFKILLLSLLLFIISLLPRIYRIELEGVNPDEPIWHGRIKNFVSAVKEGNFFYTQQSLHPAVTMEWLTAAGRVVGGHQEKIFPYSSPKEFNEARNSQIIPIALTTSLSIGLMFIFLFILSENLFVSFVSLLLISLNPFFIAHSRVFQMDGLLSSFMILSLLSLLIFVKSTRRAENKWIVISGIFGGLSILTKLPALFLVPYVLLILFIDLLKKKNWRLSVVNWKFWSEILGKVLIWSLVALMVFVVLYPAVWVRPILSVKNLIWGLVGRGLVDPHPGTDFLLGNIVDVPDWRFYPIVLAFRTTPITFIFGLGAVIWSIYEFYKTRRLSNSFFVFLFSLFFLIQMTIVSKKSDRYLLPSILSMDLLAGWGIVIFLSWIEKSSKFIRRSADQNSKLIIIFLLFTVYSFLFIPLRGHYLSYYNPLFGGAKAAGKDMVVGWGEGLYEAAQYLNDPPAGGGGVVGYYGEGMRPLIRGDFHNLIEEPNAKVDYIVLYINQVQRNRHPEALEKYYYSRDPTYTVKINGIEYVWIYEVDKD